MKILLDQIDLPEHDLRATVDEDALDELAASLRDHGQLQPIGIRETMNGRYEVVFGARRTRASRLIGWTEIEANMISNDVHEAYAAKKLIENVQREDLTPIEEAYGILALIGADVADVRSLQRQTGKSREWVRTRLALLELPEDLQGAVQNGRISIGVARAFGTIENEIVREQYVKAAIENGCTTDQAVVWAGQAKYAESGIMTMDEIQRTGEGVIKTEPPIDLQYHCFICAEMYSWRRTNTLIVCGNCQSAISEARTSDYPAGIPHLLDSDSELA